MPDHAVEVRARAHEELDRLTQAAEGLRRR